MDKYQNKYRIQSARLKGYDYTREGLYFITICTKNREHYFGEIIDHKMKLSNIGVLANVFWHEIKNHSKNVELHQFVVMPNHIHGILEIVGGCIDDIMDYGIDDGKHVFTTTLLKTKRITKILKIILLKTPKIGQTINFIRIDNNDKTQ